MQDHFYQAHLGPQLKFEKRTFIFLYFSLTDGLDFLTPRSIEDIFRLMTMWLPVFGSLQTKQEYKIAFQVWDVLNVPLLYFLWKLY